jgi:hypothetical protein
MKLQISKKTFPQPTVVLDFWVLISDWPLPRTCECPILSRLLQDILLLLSRQDSGQEPGPTNR